MSDEQVRRLSIPLARARIRARFDQLDKQSANLDLDPVRLPGTRPERCTVPLTVLARDAAHNYTEGPR